MIQKWVWSSLLCELGPTTRSINITVSILTLVAISLDRSYVIIFPLKPKLKKKHCFMIIMLTWIIGILIGIYSFYSFELSQIDPDMKYSNSNNLTRGLVCTYAEDIQSYYLFTIFLFHYIIPLIVFVLSYLILLYHIKKEIKVLYFITNMKNQKSIQILNREKVNRILFFFIT
jgi:neuropeptide Y receptor